MPSRLATVALAAVALAAVALAPLRSVAVDDARTALSEPSLSPDGRDVAFVASGDLWIAPATGGAARLLVSNVAPSGRPLYAPDGKRLAFESLRSGHRDAYVLDFASASIRRLTYDDGFVRLDGWSRDGSTVYFDSVAHQVGFVTNVMRVPMAGGTPTIAIRERYHPSSYAAPRPGGDGFAYVDGGFPQWWRRGHAHIDESAIVLARGNGLERLTPGGAVDGWPMWSSDGSVLYYVSDRSGAPNLYARGDRGATRALTHFTTGRLVFASIAYDGSAIVFERDLALWRYDVASGSARPLAIALDAAPTQNDVTHATLTSQFGELALSPDGRKVAYTARGQVFAASAKDGGDGVRITHTPGTDRGLVWAPDSARIAYESDRDGDDAIFTYDFRSATETRVTAAERAYAPAFAPDGTSLAYIRAGRELRVADLLTHATRTLATGELEEPEPFGNRRALAYSPDGRYVGFVAQAGRGYATVRVAPVAGGPARPVEYLANAGTGEITWTPDGKRLYFATSQRTEPGQIAEIDLVPQTPHFPDDAFRTLFTDTQPHVPGPPAPEIRASPAVAATPPPHVRVTPIAFDGIRDRASFLPVDVDVDELRASADGKTLVFTATAAGQSNVYAYAIDPAAKEPAVLRALTTTPGPKSDLGLAADGTVYYLEGGRAFATGPDGKTRPLGLSADLDVDFSHDKLAMFDRAWRLIDREYADPGKNGVDWQRVHDTYAPYVRGAHNAPELRRLLTLMVGELDSSHVGVGAPMPSVPPSRSGYLGAEFDGASYERDHHLRIAEIDPLGPLALDARARVGDELESVNGVPLDATTNLEALLENQIGKRVTLRVSGRTIAVAPIDANTAAGLRYRAWIASRRALVSTLSGGRLGYVHLADMSAEAVKQLVIDLDTDNESKAGVVIDVRNNNGGFVDPYVLDILSRRNYIDFTEPGRARVPERPALGQRTLDRPTVLLTNQYTLSDGENFTEDYRRAHLGRVVGEPTAGWIIFTDSVRLLDGTPFRIPHDKTLALDGQNMERHPRPVDLAVARRLGEDRNGDDAQLAAAVRDLERSLPR